MRAILVLSVASTLIVQSTAQDILSGTEPGSRPILFSTDAMVLEDAESRKDLSCSVTPQDERFQPEPPTARARNEPLNVKVLVNFGPENPASAALNPREKVALVSILRSITRNPQIGKLSLVAFDVHEQKQFYRQETRIMWIFRRWANR